MKYPEAYKYWLKHYRLHPLLQVTRYYDFNNKTLVYVFLFLYGKAYKKVKATFNMVYSTERNAKELK